MMYSPRSVSTTVIPACSKRVVEVDFLGRHALGFDDLLDVGLGGDVEDDLVGLGGVARPVDLAAVGGDVLLELLQEIGQVTQNVFFHLARLGAQPLPVDRGERGDA